MFRMIQLGKNDDKFSPLLCSCHLAAPWILGWPRAPGYQCRHFGQQIAGRRGAENCVAPAMPDDQHDIGAHGRRSHRLASDALPRTRPASAHSSKPDCYRPAFPCSRGPPYASYASPQLRKPE
jgi:hypothetical protein